MCPITVWKKQLKFLNNKSMKEDDVKTFFACPGWSMNFHCRCGFNTMKSLGKAVPVDQEAVEGFPVKSKAIIKEWWYTTKHDDMQPSKKEQVCIGRSLTEPMFQ